MTKPSPERIRRNRELLLNQYAYLGEDGEYEAAPPRAASDGSRRASPRIDTAALLGRKKHGHRYSRDEVEAAARELQLALWNQQSTSGPTPVNPLDLVEPKTALRSVGFEVLEDSSLGDIDVDGEIVGVAGVLDRDHASIRISPRFPGLLQRFTLAHELGHVVLHHGSGLHRDRALDGSSNARAVAPEEVEANWFAAAFLMPAKQVRAEFERRFLTRQFVLDSDAQYGLGDATSSVARKRRPSQADLARRLASAAYFHGVHFQSLAELFQVSERAMAIRLEELNLVRR